MGRFQRTSENITDRVLWWNIDPMPPPAHTHTHSGSGSRAVFVLYLLLSRSCKSDDFKMHDWTFKDAVKGITRALAGKNEKGILFYLHEFVLEQY